MDSADIQYGRKTVRAVEDLQVTMTTSILCKVAKLDYSDIIDEWIDWDFHHHENKTQSIAERVHNFLRYFCSRNQIPQEFFLASASLEYGSKKLDPGTPLRLVSDETRESTIVH
jgi:hypothetical protein